MRRSILFVALWGICLASTASAAGPYDQRAARNYGYDDGGAAQSPRRYNSANYQEELPPASGPEYVDQGPDDGGGGGGSPMWDQPCCGDFPCFGGAWCDRPILQGFWGRAEYLYWWVRGANTPPLVTSSPDNTPQPEAAVLPGATTLFGNQLVNTSGRSGGRFTIGYWCDPCATCGIEASFFFLGPATQDFFASSGGSPILGRPFFNTQTNVNDADLIAFPNIVTGTIAVSTYSHISGFDVNARRAIWNDDCRRVDVLAGYRYLFLGEGLQVDTHTTSIDPRSTIPVGTTFSIFDSFTTSNNFNGGQLGLNAEFFNGPWSLDFLAKFAIGAVSQRVTINGGTTVTTPGGTPSTSSGGILALQSNIGSFSRTEFGFLPEFGANLHYQINPIWRVNLGYTLLILTNVVRPGDQVDTHVDPNQFPPPIATGTSPAFAWHTSTIWMQGLSVGLECNF